MASDKDKGYPKIAKSNWFGLRDKLKQRVPTELSPSYVASVMGMAEVSAKSNVITPLKAVGIINEDGKPSELAYEWRDDSKYGEVCRHIIQNQYPQELQDLFNGPSATLEDLTSWFMRSAKVGEPAAKMYARTYLMFLDADPSKAEETQKQPKPKEGSPKRATSKRATRASLSDQVGGDKGKSTSAEEPYAPRLYIDVQIHISPDSSAEQIERIFEAMAMHLKGFKS